MPNYVDRLNAALTVLAGHGHIKQRLIKAYEDYLDDVDVDELPIALQQRFADLRTRLHQVAPLNGESPTCASVRKMSINDASDCAAQVVALYGESARLGDDEDAAFNLPMAEDSAARVPPFLVKSV